MRNALLKVRVSYRGELLVLLSKVPHFRADCYQAK